MLVFEPAFRCCAFDEGNGAAHLASWAGLLTVYQFQIRFIISHLIPSV